MDIKIVWEKFKKTPQMRWFAALIALGFLLGIVPNVLPNAVDAAVPTTLETRMESVLSMIEGAGAVRVLLNFSGAQPADLFSSAENNSIRGVIVVAEGANDLRVRIEIQRAVRALLDIDLSAIEVLNMKGGF